MTIALPGASKSGLKGLLGRKQKRTRTEGPKTATKPLQGQDVARLFSKEPQPELQEAQPAKLNEKEMRDRDRLNALRGALYSKS